MNDVTIRLATSADTKAILDMCQPIYAAVYPNSKYGLKPEHFSKTVFESQTRFDYFATMLSNNDRQCAYVAVSDDQIIGSISIERLPDSYEMHKFYVRQDFRGRGVGKQLFSKALEFATENLPIRGNAAETNKTAIDMYLRWGFHLVPEDGVKLRHWPEWPEGLVNGYISLEANKADLRVLQGTLAETV
jgi:GNAT superfamily N-acetyltransferase